MAINRKAVQRHMREMGITGICPGPNLSRRNQEHRVYPYLLRHLTAAYPNHVGGIDITDIRLTKGWLYLVAILDWFSRYVVSWQLDETLDIDCVLMAVDCALAQYKPVIWNRDRAPVRAFIFSGGNPPFPVEVGTAQHLTQRSKDQ
jgi:putative transposase